MATKDIFDKAITLEEGETLLVPCHDTRHQESLRVGLSYQRRTFLDQASADFDIIVSKVRQNNQLFVALRKVPRITSGIIVAEDGTSRPTSLKPEAPIQNEIISAARIIAAMRQDGIPEDQIQAYLSGETSIIDTSVECLSPDKLDEKEE